MEDSNFANRLRLVKRIEREASLTPERAIEPIGIDCGDGDQGGRPGVLIFPRARYGVVRVPDTAFFPNDDFCAVWHLFDMCPKGADKWTPQFKYGAG